MKTFKNILEESIKDVLHHSKAKEELLNKIHDLLTFLAKYKKIISKEVYDNVSIELNKLSNLMNKIPKSELYALEGLDESLINSLYEKLKNDFSNFIKQKGKNFFILPKESKELFDIIKISILDKNININQDINVIEKGKNLEIHYIPN